MSLLRVVKVLVEATWSVLAVVVGMPGTFATRYSVGVAWNGGTCPEVVLGPESTTEVVEVKDVASPMEDVDGNREWAIVCGVGLELMRLILVNWFFKQLRRVGIEPQEIMSRLRQHQSMRSKKVLLPRIFRGVLSEGWRKDSQ